MPSNRKKRIHERMEKTGESYAEARRQLSRQKRNKHGQYGGTPNLPDGPTTEHYDAEGRRIPGLCFPQVELVNLQGEFDPRDLKTCWVPASAFDDPDMLHNVGWPKDVKRVLTLAEYIDAREQQTGWVLERIEPGPQFMGVTMHVTLVWGPSQEDGGAP